MKRLYGLKRWVLVLVLAVLSSSAQAQEPPDGSQQDPATCATCGKRAHHSFLYRIFFGNDSPRPPDEGKPEREEFCHFATGLSPEYFRSPPSIAAPLPPERIDRVYPLERIDR
jgi:hypothetical protein